MNKVVIIGAGGLARELAEWCKDEYKVVGFSGYETDVVGNFGVDILPLHTNTRYALMAIGSPELKTKLYHQLSDRGFYFLHFIHPSSVVANTRTISQGAIVAPKCLISTDVFIGMCSYVNFMVGIGHDTIIEDFVQINPGAQIGGNAVIESGSLIGSGSTILHKVKIGKNAVVGSGSVCARNVECNTTVLGNPARKFL